MAVAPLSFGGYASFVKRVAQLLYLAYILVPMEQCLVKNNIYIKIYALYPTTLSVRSVYGLYIYPLLYFSLT